MGDRTIPGHGTPYNYTILNALVRVFGEEWQDSASRSSTYKKSIQAYGRALVALPLLRRRDGAIPCRDCLSLAAGDSSMWTTYNAYEVVSGPLERLAADERA